MADTNGAHSVASKVFFVEAGQKPIELILARNLISSLSTPAFLVDEGGVLVFYNEAAGMMLGRRFEELGTVGPDEWGSLFGPFDEGGEPIPYDELPLVASVRQRGAARHARVAGSARPTGPSTRSRPPRCRSSLRHGTRGGMAFFWPIATGGGAGVKVKLWGARGSIPSPGPGDDALRRQHLVRRGDALRRHADRPRRRHRDPQPRAGAGRTRRPGSTSCSPTCTSTTSRG